jgi:hypothetical protein
MKRNILLWVLAFIITVLVAVYQRVTGPTYPLTGKYTFVGKEFKYKLLRSYGEKSDCEITIETDKDINGYLFYKRYKTKDEYTKVPMVNKNGKLSGYLPYQPPAGKLQYFIEIYKDDAKLIIPEKKNVVIRFKGSVPTFVLIIHVIFMFGAMLLSVRTGLEYFNKSPKFKALTFFTLVFLFIGGFILGPIVQKYAFDVFWSGFPFGHDLTDNKTVITFLAWLIAFFMYKKSKQPKNWALGASIVLIVVYLIPHSVLGSELDYNKLDKEKRQQIIDSNNIGDK